MLDTVIGALAAAVRAHGIEVLTMAEEQRTLPPARLGQRLVQALLRRDADRAVRQAVTDVAGHPRDPDALGGLRWQVKKALAADPALADEVRELLREHAAVPTAPASWLPPVAPPPSVERNKAPAERKPSVERTPPVERKVPVERTPPVVAYRRRPVFRADDPRWCSQCGRHGHIASRDGSLRECSNGHTWFVD